MPGIVPHIYDVPDPRTGLLHFKVYRDKLCQLILQYLKKVEETKEQPERDVEFLPGGHAFVIGIHGPWGCGKSTLMKMVGRRLSEEWSGKIRGMEAPLTVDFQAWKYSQREELWRALLSRVVAKAEDFIDRRSEPGKDLPEDLKKAKERCDVIRNALYRDYEFSRSGALGLQWSSLPKLAWSLGNLWLSGPSLKNLEEVGEKFLEIFKREQIEEFHKRLADLDQFQQNFAELREMLGRPWLVLIDDLDRCLPEAAIEVFEATKVFLDAPGVVFVLALDKETIRRGLRVRYKEKLGEKPLVDPDLYIEKVTNISFVVPTLSSTARVTELISKVGADRVDGQGQPGVDKVLGSLLREQERHLQPNPRRWIRLLNTALLYSEMKDAVAQRAQEQQLDQGSGEEEPRVEVETATKEDKAFLKLLCLSYRWGGFMEAALNSWEVMATFEQAASQAERNFEKFKKICSQKYPSLRMYAEDADLFQLLLSEPPIGDPKPDDLIMQLF